MSLSVNPAATETHVFSASDLRRRIAAGEAEKAAAQARALEEQAAKQKAVMDEFQKPPARSKDQLLALLMQLANRAAERGESEVQVYVFPSFVCTDKGRAINNSDPNWPNTLTGRPRLAYDFWQETLKPLGLGLKVQILDYPGGFPGDVGMSLTW